MVNERLFSAVSALIRRRSAYRGTLILDRGQDRRTVHLGGEPNAHEASGTPDPGRRGLDERAAADDVEGDEDAIEPSDKSLGAQQAQPRIGKHASQPVGVPGAIDLEAQGRKARGLMIMQLHVTCMVP